MQLALQKYENNLFQAKIESEKEIKNLNQTVESGNLERLTALRAKQIKRSDLKLTLEDQIKESRIRSDAEREMIRSQVCTGFKS